MQIDRMDQKKIKILYLFVSLNYGGAETALFRNLKGLDRDVYEPCVVSIEKKGAVGEEIERLGVEVIYLNDKARLFSPALMMNVLKILKERKPDILQASLFYANFYGRMAAIFSRPKAVIIEEHSMYTEKKFYHVLIDKLLSIFTDKIIVCSRSVLDFTISQEKIGKDKFFLIYNAVDSKRFDIPASRAELRKKYGFSQNDFIVGTVGMVIPKKGHRFLIEAASSLKSSIPPLKVLIVGDGEERCALEKLVRSEGLSGRVVFTGERRDVPELMKTMDIFVLPSLQEGFPITILEAMYTGLPVVASDISGIPEIIEDGANGSLIPPSDVDSLKENIAALYKDADTRERYASNAREKIESGYLPGHYMAKLEGLYQSLLK